MPLTADQEQLEHELRVRHMETQIETGRVNIEKMRKDMRLENWKVGISLVVGAAACVGAGVALANYVNSKNPPVPPQPQIIYVVPSQSPTLPGTPPK